MGRVDPVTLEVIRNGLVAASDEMRSNLMRTAYNPIIYEVLDFSVGLFDRDCRMVAQAAGLPIFLGNLGIAVGQVVKDVGLADMRPGDVYLINDPYLTGNHVNDVTAISPIFCGPEVVGFTAARAHWLDLGGKDPGGSTDSTDVFQEGIRLRSVRLFREDRLDRSVYRILHDNVRYPESHMGDLRAQVAACRTGENRVVELASRLGRDVVVEGMAELIAQGETLARQAIGRIPDGVYSADTYLDNDGVGKDPVRIRVTVTVDKDRMLFDLGGSSPAVQGPINCGFPATICGCRIAFKCLTSPHQPANEGHFAPLEVVAPEGSLFNATYPASTFLYMMSLNMLIEAVLKALSPALPDRIPAGHYGEMGGFMIFGVNPGTGRPYIHQEPEGGGWGAGAGFDGENVMIFLADGDTHNCPAEIIENRFPLRVERYALREGSGGAGRYRGGLGHYRDYRILGHDAQTTCIMDRSVFRPWGVFRGHDGEHSVVVINEALPGARRLMKATGHRLKAGDVVSVRTGGGGGYGDPLERDPEAVRLDVKRDYVTIEEARRVYGVVVDPGLLTVDPVATAELRDQLKKG
ncbi:MAG: hydantoinase B/oxoprolinase family protein [Bacillota bacterium]|nr:MAG: hydantoinase B/oxoprolinase family protein [Bacillota bacterium]